MSIHKLECFKKTSDNWYPNHYKELVAVTLFKNSEYPACPSNVDRVCVWGNDDCGMEYDGEDAEYKFNRILEMDDVTFKALKDLGLQSA